MKADNNFLTIRLFFIFILITAVCEGTNGQGAYIPPDRPKLIIGIVVEQLRYDQLEKFRDKLGDNGIRKLLNEGTYFKNAWFD